MLRSLRRWFAPSRRTASVHGPVVRPSVEPLEDRATPADVTVFGAALLTPTTVGVAYQAVGAPAFQVAAFRSSDAVLDGSDVPVALPARVTPSPTFGPQLATIPLAAELPIDPARPYVLVAADPLQVVIESDEANNVTSFRKLALGAVVHGLQPNGQVPGWVAEAAEGMYRRGFASVIPFDWAALSQSSARGVTSVAGTILATQVWATADALGVLPNDAVDVQFVSHSRGAPVVSQALQVLAHAAPRELALGYVQATFLDPHPAANRGAPDLNRATGVSSAGGFSFSPLSATGATAAATTLAFQAAAADPPVVVPANVDRAEVIYQRPAWSQTVTEERALGFNLWGLRPGDLVNQSGRPVVGLDIGVTGVGHSSVQHWYIAAFLGG